MPTLTLLALFAPLVALAGAPEKDIPTERDDLAEDAAGSVAFVLPDDAPRPPATMIKKTQSTELSTNPAKTPITKLEDGVYQLQKPYASIWSYLETAEGGRVPLPSEAVKAQVAALRPLLDEVRAAHPTWHRLAEYEEHVAFFEHVLATRIAYAEGHTAARAQAAAEAEAAYDAAWKAKRADDDGLHHAFHASHVGQVVFAAAAMGVDDAVTPLSQTSVDAPLFARAWLAESGWNAMHTQGVDCGDTTRPAFRFATYATVGGTKWELGKVAVDEATFKTATTLEIGPGSLTAGGTYGRDDEETAPFRWLASVAPSLADGDNPVEIEVRAWCSESPDHAGFVVAKGSLTVRADAASRAAIAARGAYAMGPSVHAASALSGIRDKLARHYGGRGGELIDLRTASEWAPVRHPATGILLYREAEAVALVRETGGTRCDLHSVTLREPYDGSSYGPSLDLGMDIARAFVCTVR